MNIHEFQAKALLQRYGIPLSEFYVISSLAEVDPLLEKTGWQEAVVKVQVHAGGRGKAGGVIIAHTPHAIRQAVGDLLGKRIINSQTGADGLVSHYLLLSPLLKIVQEYYLALTIDRPRAQQVLIASPVGGMEIEQIAHAQPDQVLILPFPSDGHLRSYHYLHLAKFMGWQESLAQQGIACVKALTQAFQENDMTLLEINPLVKTAENQLVALDAKVVIDDNALYRHPALKALFDATQVPEQEAHAQQFELAYVALEGTIGCMVNGAGLAMATMDLIHYYGGQPANFLDVGGGASQEKVAEGFKIILSDPKVKAILVNIFGGIMNCATLAAGIIAAAKEQQIRVPLVVRMEGTNVEQGKQMLEQSGLAIQIAPDLTAAAQQVVQLAQ